MIKLNKAEKKTGSLFGELFKKYSQNSYLESIELFKKRLKLNRFDTAWIKGKKCLDAGCGGGRISIALSQLGAAHVTGLDLSKNSIRDARARAKELGIENVKFLYSPLEKIPFRSGEFDFVVCSGVLMHTRKPLQILNELSRVLRPGGLLFGLVYATEGVRWPLVQMLRPLAHLTGFDDFDRAVQGVKLPVNKRRTYLDDLFVPYIDFYSWPFFEEALTKSGFHRIRRWTKGRLDHEESIETYFRDLANFYRIFDHLAKDRKNPNQALFAATKAICRAAVNYVTKVSQALSAGEISPKKARDLAIGQGHHRFLAQKK